MNPPNCAGSNKPCEQMAEAGEQPWSLYSFERGEDLLRQLRRETFDLLILDWQLPDLTGLSLLLWTREHMEAPPAAIMLTSRDGESDIVQALNAGADDYVSKPFRPNELKARVAAVLRRHSQQRAAAGEILSFNDLVFDDAELTVTRDGKPIVMTEREYRLAHCLFSNLGRPLSRDYLYERFWPHEEIVFFAATGYAHLSSAQQARADSGSRLAVADDLWVWVSVGECGVGERVKEMIV